MAHICQHRDEPANFRNYGPPRFSMLQYFFGILATKKEREHLDRFWGADRKCPFPEPTLGVNSVIINTQQSFNPCYPAPDLPETLDITVLNLLIHRALDRADSFYGLSLHNIIRATHGFKMYGGAPKFTRKEIGVVRRALILLERSGLAYQIRRSKSRWFPSSRAIARHGIAEGYQTSLTRWI